MRTLLPVVTLLAACGDAPRESDAPASGPPASRAPVSGTDASSGPDGPAADPGARPTPMDGWASRRTVSPDGRWDARVADGGVLTVRRGGAHPGDDTDGIGVGGAIRTDGLRIDTEVDARVVFAGDTLYYARRGAWAETDLWRVSLPNGKPEQVTAWQGSEDRPVMSPDGRRLAFVSGRTGLASWWVVGLDELPATDGIQVTNVGVTRGRPGQPPAGWVPVPDGHVYRWDRDGLVWVSEGVEHRVEVPE